MLPQGSVVSPPIISVIAADAGLRQSLVFSLEVEGYRVEAHDYRSDWSADDNGSFCLIVDADVLADRPFFIDQIRSSGRSVILLEDGISPRPTDLSADILTKPFVGADLLTIVRRIRCHA